jgi:hypothetical protein
MVGVSSTARARASRASVGMTGGDAMHGGTQCAVGRNAGRGAMRGGARCAARRDARRGAMRGGARKCSRGARRASLHAHAATMPFWVATPGNRLANVRA